jgi:hypothetical protein
MRKFGGTLLAIAIAVVGVIGLIAFFNSRDSSTAGGERTQPDPGVASTVPGDSLLEQGNVVLRYSDRTFTPALRKLASDLGAPDSPELRAAGQAVVLRLDPKAGGVIADAFKHTLTVVKPSDPRLQSFIERWLGQVASG